MVGMSIAMPTTFSALQPCKLLRELYQNLDAVMKWSQANALKLNAGKTQVLRVCSRSVCRQLLDRSLSVSVSSVSVVFSDCVVDLGLVLDGSLSFEGHVSRRISACW